MAEIPLKVTHIIRSGTSQEFSGKNISKNELIFDKTTKSFKINYLDNNSLFEDLEYVGDSRFLKLTGGTLTGTLRISTPGGVRVSNDVNTADNGLAFNLDSDNSKVLMGPFANQWHPITTYLTNDDIIDQEIKTTTADWAAATDDNLLDLRPLFAMRNNSVSNILNSTIIGRRFTLKINSNLVNKISNSGIRYFQVTAGYVNNSYNVKVTIESKVNDEDEWGPENIVTIAGQYGTSSFWIPVPNISAIVRFTFEWVDTPSANFCLNNLLGWSHREGEQGAGWYNRMPFTWTEDRDITLYRNLYPRSNNNSSLGNSMYRFNNAYLSGLNVAGKGVFGTEGTQNQITLSPTSGITIDGADTNGSDIISRFQWNGVSIENATNNVTTKLNSNQISIVNDESSTGTTITTSYVASPQFNGKLQNALTIGSKTYDNRTAQTITFADFDVEATATTGAAGSNASVTVEGNTFNFTIPKGDTGAQGPQGIQGPAGADGQDGLTTAIKFGNHASNYTQSGGVITIPAADILTSAGITATATELNYVDGVTSSVQSQLNNKLSLSGGTVSDYNSIKVTSKYGQEYYYRTSSNSTNLIDAPFSSQWHIISAFPDETNITDSEISTDGASWIADSEGTDLRPLFILREQLVSGILSSTVKKRRFTFNSTTDIPLTYSLVNWIELHIPSGSAARKFNFIVESKSSSSDWVELKNFQIETPDGNPYSLWIPVNAFGNVSFIRFTFEQIDVSIPDLSLCAINLWTNRIGGQGKGKYVEFPFGWSEDRDITLYRNLYPTTNNSGSIGNSIYRFSNIYSSGLDVSGTATIGSYGMGQITVSEEGIRLFYDENEIRFAQNSLAPQTNNSISLGAEGKIFNSVRAGQYYVNIPTSSTTTKADLVFAKFDTNKDAFVLGPGQDTGASYYGNIQFNRQNSAESIKVNASNGTVSYVLGANGFYGTRNGAGTSSNINVGNKDFAWKEFYIGGSTTTSDEGGITADMKLSYNKTKEALEFIAL